MHTVMTSNWSTFDILQSNLHLNIFCEKIFCRIHPRGENKAKGRADIDLIRDIVVISKESFNRYLDCELWQHAFIG